MTRNRLLGKGATPAPGGELMLCQVIMIVSPWWMILPSVARLIDGDLWPGLLALMAFARAWMLGSCI